MLSVVFVASKAEAERPVDGHLPNDQVPAPLVALTERMLSYAGSGVVFSFERLDPLTLLTHGYD